MMVRGPLPPVVSQVANQAVKGMVGPQVQKLIDAQVGRVTAPLIARIEELERRVAALEKGSTAPPSAAGTRSSDI
jgi:hypothetical protein